MCTSSNMTERPKIHLGGLKPIPMKLIAIGDVDRSPSYCASRVCSVRLIRLLIIQPLEGGLQSVTIAVKMEGSKRTLRSTEIEVSSTGVLDTELDLSLSLQYPHYLKQRHNLLYVMLQRRKRYKNRRILGYKTLAVGIVDMNDVLQRAVDQDLHLYANMKDKETPVAKITMVSLSTLPVNAVNGKESLEDENTSDEDEFTSEMSDSDGDAAVDETLGIGETSKSRRKVLAGRQVNFKQKFISLLRKFKASESDVFDAEAAELEAHEKAVLEDDLLDELEFDSDSGPEFFDNISVQSTPRPHLSPYFKPGRSGSSLLVPPKVERTTDKSDEGSRNNSDSHPDNLTDEDGGGLKGEEMAKRKAKIVLHEKSSSMREKEAREKLSKKLEPDKEPPRDYSKLEGRKFSQTIPVEPSPRKLLLDQLNQVFPSPDEELPGYVVWVNGNHGLGQYLYEKLRGAVPPVVCASSTGDLKACFSQLANRLQKTHFGKMTTPLRVVLCGGDEFVNAVLRAYVELFADRPPDLQSCIRFVFIPVGQGALARYVAQIDACAATYFDDQGWHSALEQQDAGDVDWDMIVERIRIYVQSASSLINLPIAQAMISFKNHGLSEADSPQMFIPFLSDVRVSGSGGDVPPSTLSTDPEETPHAFPGMSIVSSAPTLAAGFSSNDFQKDFSPPHSPNVQLAQTLPSPSTIPAYGSDAMELQLDYWMLGGSGEEKERERKRSDISRSKHIPSTKTSVKAGFKSLYIVRPMHGVNMFTLLYATKEKKIQIMRALGKKTKDSEIRTVVVEAVNRLICRTSKPHNSGMKVAIDGCDWQNISFFQLSPQWHSAVKYLPILVCRDD